MPSTAIAVGDRFLLQFSGTLLGQHILSTWCLGLSIKASPDYESLGAIINTDLGGMDTLLTRYLAAAPSNYTLSEVWFQRIYSSRLYKLKYTNGGVGGTAAARVSNVAQTIERRGAIANKRNISSLHIPLAVDTTTVALGELTSAQLILANAVASASFGQVVTTTGDTLDFVINNDSAALGGFSVIVQAFAQTTTRVMRRRTLRVGE